MGSIFILYNMWQIPCYALMLSVIPIRKANHRSVDYPTKVYANWIDCLKSQKEESSANKIVHQISKHGSPWGKWVTFSGKILAITLKVGRWDNPEDLFASQDFIAMYKHPAYYWRYAIDYLGNPGHQEKHKKIAIYGLENLGYEEYLFFAKACYKLYQKKHLSESLFQMVLGYKFLGVHPLVMAINVKNHHTYREVYAFLVKVQSEVSINSSIKPFIAEMLSGRLAHRWSKKQKIAYLHYKDRLPFADVIEEAYEAYQQIMTGKMDVQSYIPDKPPYFLMIYDHPYYYIKNDLELFLKRPHYTIMGKRFAVVAMQQLYGPLGSRYCNISDRYYSHIYFHAMQAIRRLYEDVYLDADWDPLLVHLIADCMHPNQAVFSVFYPYSFSILHYEGASDALRSFINSSAIPCGIRNMATKMLNGSLATRKELAHIKNEVKLYTSHFRLYESILLLT